MACLLQVVNELWRVHISLCLPHEWGTSGGNKLVQHWQRPLWWERAENEGEAIDLLVYLRSYPQISFLQRVPMLTFRDTARSSVIWLGLRVELLLQLKRPTEVWASG